MLPGVVHLMAKRQALALYINESAYIYQAGLRKKRQCLANTLAIHILVIYTTREEYVIKKYNKED